VLLLIANYDYFLTSTVPGVCHGKIKPSKRRVAVCR